MPIFDKEPCHVKNYLFKLLKFYCHLKSHLKLLTKASIKSLNMSRVIFDSRYLRDLDLESYLVQSHFKLLTKVSILSLKTCRESFSTLKQYLSYESQNVESHLKLMTKV